MSDRYHGPAAIFITDRGYESFNTFTHVIQAGQKFLIRMKDIDSNGILSAYDLPEGEFDTRIETTLTRRHTKETKGHPEIYTILSPKTDFDFLDCETQYYKISFAPCGSKRAPAMSALQQIFQPRIFRLTCSGSFTCSGGAKNQLNTPSDWLTSTPGSRN